MTDSQDMQEVIEKLSEGKISDDYDLSGALSKRREGHSNVFRKVSRTFYALALPQGQECVEGEERGDLIFEDLKEALLKLRYYKGSRLKGFSNEEEAITFTSTQSESVNSSDKDRTQITPQMLIRLKKTIENGDAKAFAEMVWRNPRILIGKADYPSVLQIICSCSKQADGASIAKIQEAFKCIFYVTILRADNFLSPPVVGRPSLKRNVFDEIRPDFGAHAILNETALKIKAFAGPMTKEEAESFHQLLKYPSSVSLGSFMYRNEDLIVLQKIRRTDPEKGLERIARLLADDLNVVYMEYFPMLNLFTNLSKKEGLLILENYINGLPNSCPERIVLPAAGESVVAAYLDPKAHVNSLGHDINVHLHREQYKDIISSEEQYFTPPSSPDSDYEYVLAPEHPIVNSTNMFIDGGFSMTRHDVDALLALCDNNVCVDEKTFPLVYRWKNRVEEKLRECQDDLKEMKHFTPLASIVIPRVVYIDAPTAATLVPEHD